MVTEKRPKVLIIYNRLWNYRIKIFELINQRYDLTVAFIHEEDKKIKSSFKTIYTPVISIKSFVFHKINLFALSKKYDVIIGLSDIKWLSLMALGFNYWRKYKLIYWGIGVMASYSNSFDKSNKWDLVRYFFNKKADAIIFYSEYPISKYIDAGFERQKLFVAHNTVNVHESQTSFQFKRSNLLFIGTLYKQKGIEILLNAYSELINEGNELPNLLVVGGGSLYPFIENWIQENQLSNKIKLMGPIYDEFELEKIFKSSIMCISPNQAGLSLLSSMAYGVVFVTKENAITGGEIFNLRNNYNGLFYDGSIKDLKRIIMMSICEKEKIIEIGNNAREFYYSKRKPEMMADSIIKAIEFTIGK